MLDVTQRLTVKRVYFLVFQCLHEAFSLGIVGQAPEARQSSADLGHKEVEQTEVATPEGKQTWPKTMPEQVAVIRVLLSKGPQSCEALADQFKRTPTKAIEQVLAALHVLGHAERDGTQWHRT